MQELTSTKVFISYSWSSDTHKDWVVGLAERLRANGVDAILDRWDLKEGQDTIAFMEQMVTDITVTKVVVVCDRTYVEKADDRRGGVGTESQIISKEVYDKVREEKFVPLFLEKTDEGKPLLPVFFRSRLAIDFTDPSRFEESYDQLLRNLLGRPELKKPSLGKPPAHLFVEPANQVTTVSRLTALRDAFNRNRPHTEVMVRDYLDTLLEATEAIRVAPTRSVEEPPFDDRLLTALTTFTPYRDNYVDFIELTGQFLEPSTFEEAIAPFFETLLTRFGLRDGETSHYAASFDFDKFIAFEITLYTLASLIRVGKYQHAARLIEGSYTGTKHQQFYTSGLDAFREYIASLEETRKNRLKLNLYSVTADVLRTRATLPKVPFNRLAEVDLILSIRPFFPSSGGFGRWYSCLAPYLERGGYGQLELFARGVTDRGFRSLKELLKVSSPADFLRCADKMIADSDFQKMWRGERMYFVDITKLLNLDGFRVRASGK